MLLAQLSNGTMISLLDHYTKDQLKQLSKKYGFYCPSCRESVLMKMGDKKAWHFAHRTNADCQADSEKESPYHLEGKKLLYEWLNQHETDVGLESYIESIAKRPDLLIRNRFALEFQCSTIDSSLFKQRTTAYFSSQKIPIWILGKKRMKPLSPYVYKISSFDWLCATSYYAETGYPEMLYFCPQDKAFYKLSYIVPISSTKVIARLAKMPLSTCTFTSIIHPAKEAPAKYPIQIWLEAKKRWRLSSFKQNTLPYRYVKHLFLQHRSSISFFPGEAGIPVKYAHMIETPCFLWQSWMLLQFLSNTPLGENVSFDVIFKQFKELVKLKVFKPREFPLITNGHYSFAIMNYLHALCARGVLKRVAAKEFVKTREVTLPDTMEEAIRNDYRMTFTNLFIDASKHVSGKM